jgi:hypothetical protein
MHTQYSQSLILNHPRALQEIDRLFNKAAHVPAVVRPVVRDACVAMLHEDAVAQLGPLLDQDLLVEGDHLVQVVALLIFFVRHRVRRAMNNPSRSTAVMPATSSRCDGL